MSHELGSLTPPAITMRGDETMSRSIVPRSGWERGQGSVRRKCRSRKARRQAQRGSSPRWGFATSGKLSHCPDKNMWRCVSVQERVCVCMRSGARAPNTPKESRKSLIGEDCLLNSVRKHPQVLAHPQRQKNPQTEKWCRSAYQAQPNLHRDRQEQAMQSARRMGNGCTWRRQPNILRYVVRAMRQGSAPASPSAPRQLRGCRKGTRRIITVRTRA